MAKVFIIYGSLNNGTVLPFNKGPKVQIKEQRWIGKRDSPVSSRTEWGKGLMQTLQPRTPTCHRPRGRCRCNRRVGWCATSRTPLQPVGMQKPALV